jgi:hypothetical protein
MVEELFPAPALELLGDIPCSDLSKSDKRSLHLLKIILPLVSISSLSLSLRYVVPFHLASSSPSPSPSCRAGRCLLLSGGSVKDRYGFLTLDNKALSDSRCRCYLSVMRRRSTGGGNLLSCMLPGERAHHLPSLSPCLYCGSYRVSEMGRPLEMRLQIQASGTKRSDRCRPWREMVQVW